MTISVPSVSFTASLAYVGEKCYICDKWIKLGEDLRYYGGPYIMHDACIKQLIELA